MKSSGSRSRTLLVALVLCSAALAWAQENEPKRGYTSMINVDAMIDNYSRMLARKYDLNDEQDAFTQHYLRDKCNQFLGRNRDQLFDLVDRMFEVRNGGEMSPEELMQWGKRALPLYEQAKAVIVESNTEWRGILNDDQRKIHDADMNTMFESFGQTEDQLRRIVSGEMTLDEFRRGQPNNPGKPMRPAAPGVPLASGAPAGVGVNQPRTPPPARDPGAPPKPAAQPPTVAQPPAVKPATPAAPPAKEAPKASDPNDTEKARAEALERLRKIREQGQQNAGKQGGAPAGTPAPGPVDPGKPSAPGGAAAPGAAKGARGGPAAGGQKAGADFESQWEAYVREFIQKYQLTEEQTQRAQSILRDCQEQGRNYMAKHQAEIAELDKRTQELGGAAAAKDKSKEKELRQVNERRAKVFEPINSIFERQLKPRLERLLTRAQRQMAEAQKSQPGKRGAAGQPGKPGAPGAKPGEQPQPVPPPVPVPPQEMPPQEPPQDPGEPKVPGQDQ